MTKRAGPAATRLLVVHWHPVVLKGLASYFGNLRDIEIVGTAITCDQALRLAAELRPQLVLMGYSMPDLGGIEATRRLIEASPPTRVLLIGAFDDPERRAQALESGAVGFVYLGSPPADIASLMRRAVATGTA